MSKITIFNTHLTPERSAWLDIEDYLGTLTPIYHEDNFQYLKMSADMTLKIPLRQEIIPNFEQGNYMRIEQDGQKWYYFIFSTSWLSQSAVSFFISIDSVNTFADSLEWSDKTLVNREHKDRYVFKEGKEQLIRKIDRIPEGINAEKILTDTKIITCYQDVSRAEELNWYLLYRNKDLDYNAENQGEVYVPFNTYLLADRDLKLYSSASTDLLTVNDLYDGQYIYFTDIDNPGGVFELNDSGQRIEFTRTGYEMIGLRRSGSKLYSCHYYIHDEGEYTEIQKRDSSGTFDWYVRFPTKPYAGDWVAHLQAQTGPWIPANSLKCHSSQKYRTSNENYLNLGPYGVVNKLKDNEFIRVMQTGRFAILGSEFVNRTDSKIVKFLKMPYCPIDFTYDSNTNVWGFGDKWEFQEGRLGLVNQNHVPDFESKINDVEVNELFDITINEVNPYTPKNNKYESKFLHSEFYYKRFKYDNYGWSIGLENLIVDPKISYNWDSKKFKIPIYFKQTNTLSSNFLFQFDKEANTNSLGKWIQAGEYEDFLLVNRNNEEALYHSEFLNYSRYGYNYDKKQGALGLANQVMGFAGSVGKAAFGAASNASRVARIKDAYDEAWGWYNEGLADAYSQAGETGDSQMYLKTVKDELSFTLGAIGSGGGEISAVARTNWAIGGATQAINLITSAIDMKDGFNRTKDSLNAKPVSVSGSGDIDLFQKYGKNKLWMETMEVSPESKKFLGDLFHLYGYASGIRKIPNFNNRYWFNHIQCEPVFIEDINNPQPANIYLNDLKARFMAGVTRYHKHDGIWDWNQEYENWENSLVKIGKPVVKDYLKVNIDTWEWYAEILKDLDGIYTWATFRVEGSSEYIDVSTAGKKLTAGETWTIIDNEIITQHQPKAVEVRIMQREGMNSDIETWEV